MQTNLGTVQIIATPIGNLSDISARAIETLQSVDVIYCEDTRVTKKLLSFYTIDTPTAVYHQHSTDKTIKQIYQLIKQGKNIAFVSDAGTPAISDPGGRLVEGLFDYAKKEGIDNDLIISPIPGPSAVISALSVCGFPCQIYTFLGFPPHKKGRKTFFEQVAQKKETLVFFESTHRIEKAIKELQEVLSPNRKLVICRELTKKFETIYRGTIGEIAEKQVKAKGEFVIVVNKE